MAHFRDTYKPARFFFLDVRVGVVLFASLLHVTWWTLGLDALVVALALYVERIGLGFIGTLRAVRSYFSGTWRPALRIEKIRGKVDYERLRLAWEKVPDTTPVVVEPLEKSDPLILKGPRALRKGD